MYTANEQQRVALDANQRRSMLPGEILAAPPTDIIVAVLPRQPAFTKKGHRNTSGVSGDDAADAKE